MTDVTPMLHALLVGIDRYHHVTPLRGCVRDIHAIERLLRERIAPDAVSIRRLCDDEATRAAIISAFRTHLAAAKPGEVALFYFCGHGSTEPCPPEWSRFEPSGRNQTLVPVDGRAPGVFDIADKELATLIAEVATTGADVVCITDSCHAAGNTRDAPQLEGMTARTAPSAAAATRTLADYLATARTLYDPDAVVEGRGGFGRHIALAACQGHQRANETDTPEGARGVFSRALEDAVEALGASATYADIAAFVTARVGARTQAQDPDLFLTHAEDRHRCFLQARDGGAEWLAVSDGKGRWQLSAGGVQGVPPDGIGVAFALFDAESSDQRRGSVPIATARPTMVDATRTVLRISEGAPMLDETRAYRARLAGLPTVLHLRVVTDVDLPSTVRETTVRRLRDVAGLVLHDAEALVTPDAPAAIAVAMLRGTREGWTLEARAGDAPTTLTYGHTDDDVTAMLRAIAQIRDWHRLRVLDAPASPLTGLIRTELLPTVFGEGPVPADRTAIPAESGRLSLTYAPDDASGELFPPGVVIRLRHSYSHPLYVGAYVLHESFESQLLFADWIPAGAVAFVAGGQPRYLQFPDWAAADVTQMTTLIRAVACTRPFDAAAWTRPALFPRSSRPFRGPVAERPSGAADPQDTASTVGQWGTSLLTIVTTCP